MARPDSRRSFPLAGAFALSVVLHLLLALLTMLSPWVTDTAALDELEDPNEITFTFVDRPDGEDTRSAEPAPDGNTPVPLPVEAPEPEVEGGEELGELPVPEPPIEESAPPDDTAEAVEAIREAEQLPPPPPVEASPTPRLDVNEALRDFGELLQRTPAPRPRGRPDTPSNVIVPDLSQVPSSGFGVGNLTFESADYDWSDYGRQIYMAIWRAWHSRLYATTDDFEKWAHQRGQWYLNNQSAVRFVIERNGQVSGIALEGASGCGPLDASALDALAEVILPPLPADFPRDAEIVHARFVAVGEVRGMRPTLRRLRQMGLF